MYGDESIQSFMTRDEDNGQPTSSTVGGASLAATERRWFHLD